MSSGRCARRRGLSVGAIAGVAIALSACGDSSTSSVEIPAQDPGLVATGAVLYEANCAECHGGDLRGTDRGPSHLSAIYGPNHHADISFQLAVERGVRAHHWTFGDMDPVEGLTSDDVDAIVAFVRETQRVEGFEPFPP